METPILLIEDDADICDLVRLHLEEAGFRVDTRADGRAGLEAALAGSHELVILDLNLPHLDGLDVCRRLQAERPSLPIMMLTSRTEEVDRVLGLELGADDYLTKPFGVRELLARVRAILRRAQRPRADEDAVAGHPPLRRGELLIDVERRTVHVSGEEVGLTAKEFDLLLLLASRPGRVYSRQQLLEQVWGYQYRGYEHTVNSHIHRLRSKIETDPAAPRYVTTVWGVGYRFSLPEQD